MSSVIKEILELKLAKSCITAYGSCATVTLTQFQEVRHIKLRIADVTSMVVC